MTRLSRKIGFVLARATLRSLGVRAMPVVLIMGHMRCGSTLLLHILLSNPECIGCGERNVAYRSTADLDRLEIAARIAQHAPFRMGHAIDQINHDHLTPDPEILCHDRVRCIFLVREPRTAISSIVRLTQKFYEPWTIERAVDYYSLRLQTLAVHAASLGSRQGALALTYNDLVYNTPQTLRRVEAFLHLGSELREDYAIQTFTGKRGDPGQKIRTGRVVREPAAYSAEIPEAQYDRAAEAYRSCARVLQNLSNARSPGRPLSPDPG